MGGENPQGIPAIKVKWKSRKRKGIKTCSCTLGEDTVLSKERDAVDECQRGKKGTKRGETWGGRDAFLIGRAKMGEITGLRWEKKRPAWGAIKKVPKGFNLKQSTGEGTLWSRDGGHRKKF